MFHFIVVHYLNCISNSNNNAIIILNITNTSLLYVNKFSFNYNDNFRLLCYLKIIFVLKYTVHNLIYIIIGKGRYESKR